MCCLVKWSSFWLKCIIDRISIRDSSSLFLFFTLLYCSLVSRKEGSSFILSAGLHIINLPVSLLLYEENKWANIWGNALQYSPCWENTLSECDDHKAPAKNSILFLSKNQFCWCELMGCMFCFFVCVYLHLRKRDWFHILNMWHKRYNAFFSLLQYKKYFNVCCRKITAYDFL